MLCKERKEEEAESQKRISRTVFFHSTSRRYRELNDKADREESLQSIVQCDPLVRIDTATQD